VARLTGLGGRGRTGSSHSGGRYGLLLAVLITTYLLNAFSATKLATEVQVVLFAAVLLISLRTSLLNHPWPGIIAAVTVIGTAAVFLTSLTGTRTGKATEDLWKTA
jgi:hypothetical protein